MKITDKYVFFWNGTFSQWKRHYPFIIKGMIFNCAEQYMMYKKAMLFGDQEIADLIMDEEHPRDQKDWGRKIKNFDTIEWEAKCKQFVFEANYAKFTQNPALKTQLLATEDRLLVEASPTDKIWGIGLAEDAPGIEDPTNWLGTNWLGEILTEVKKQIQYESK
jgi:ribA/ribD-fused uncharacterized protein